MSEDTNSSREGKDLAAEEKMEFERVVKEQIETLHENEVRPIIINNTRPVIFAKRINDEQCCLFIGGEIFATIDQTGITYTTEKVEKSLGKEKTLQQVLEQSGFPHLKEAIDRENEHKKKEDKDDNKPELQEESGDLLKEEIAQEYQVEKNNVIHLSMRKKIIQEKNFSQLVPFAKQEEYTDIFVIPGEQESSNRFIGRKQDGKTEEIKQMQDATKLGGTNPDKMIKRIEGENITEVKPLAMYKLDQKTSIAIIKRRL